MTPVIDQRYGRHKKAEVKKKDKILNKLVSNKGFAPIKSISACPGFASR
jgi:hypothetical protein